VRTRSYIHNKQQATQVILISKSLAEKTLDSVPSNRELGIPRQRRRIQSKEQWPPGLQLRGDIVIQRINERISDQHQVGLEISDLLPSVPEQDLFVAIEIGFHHGNAEFGPI
jgi:hypothetical protein